MFNTDIEFQELVESAVIQENFTANELTISTAKLSSNCYYACYLLVNGRVVLKESYQLNTEFKLDISQYDFSDRLVVKYYFFDKKLDIRLSKSIFLTEMRKEHFFLDQALSMYRKDAYFDFGKNLIEKESLKLGTFPEYKLDLTRDFWEDNPFNNRSWQWRLHWFEFLGYVMAYHLKNKDNSSLDVSKRCIESWLNKYILKKTKFEFVWHDHATALRAEILLVYYIYLQSYAKEWSLENTFFLERVYLFLSLCQKKLSEESFYSKHTNHGLEQARVLLLLGVFFDNDDAKLLAINRLSSELDYSFTEEGVHKENSPGYHQFVLKVFLSIISKFPKYILGDLESKFSFVGEKALEFIAHILRPDAKLPIIGDTELLPATDSYAEYFGGSKAYQDYAYAASQGRRGLKPSINFKIYPLSGYAIYRNKWETTSSFKDIVHLILKSGTLSQYHHQQDESNIVLFAFGEDWLIDSGLYNYINKDPIRKYVRSREAHNVPVISNSVYRSDFKHRTQHWSLSCERNHDELVITTKNDVLIGISQERKILINDSQQDYFNFIVKDTIIILDKASKEVSFAWHIPRDKTISKEGNVISITSKMGNTMTMVFDPTPEDIVIEKGIDSNGRIVSCTSNRFGKYEDSQLIRVIYSANEELSVRTEFFMKKIKGDLV